MLPEKRELVPGSRVLQDPWRAQMEDHCSELAVGAAVAALAPADLGKQVCQDRRKGGADTRNLAIV